MSSKTRPIFVDEFNLVEDMNPTREESPKMSKYSGPMVIPATPSPRSLDSLLDIDPNGPMKIPNT